MNSENLFFIELYTTINTLIGSEGRTLNELQGLISIHFPSTFTEYDNMKLNQLHNEILEGRGEQENLLKQIMEIKNNKVVEKEEQNKEESQPIDTILA